MLKDTKSRVILLIVVVILLVVGLFTYFSFRSDKEVSLSQAELKGPPSVRSIPGDKTATTAYKEAVEAQNIRQAEEAEKTGGSSVPTITQPTYQGSQGFPGGAPIPPGCNPDDLRKARAAGVKAEELRCKGCSAEQLKAVGYTAGELKEAGFTADQLKRAGYNTSQLRAAGFTANELKKAGFSVAQLKSAGYNAKELRQAGFTPDDLKQAGFTDAEIVAAEKAVGSDQPGFPKDCSPESLKKALAANIPADQIKQALNCDAKSLKASGYKTEQLKKAGFTAGELKEAGFTPKELKDGGYTPSELRDAGYTAAQLKDAGFAPDELKNGGYSRGDLLRGGFTPEQLKEISASPLSENFPKDCSPESLKRAFAANVPVSEIKKALGCDATSLKASGYSPKQLKDGGFNADELKKGGFTPQELKQAGFTPEEMKAAGLGDKDLKDAGFTPTELSGTTGAEQAILNQTGFPKDCTPSSLAKAKRFNISPEQIRQVLNCDATALKAAGYSPTEVKKAGFSPEELKNAGFTAGQLKAAGVDNADLVRAGFSPEEIRQAASFLGTGAGSSSDLSGEIPSIPPDRQAQFLADLRKRQTEQLSDQQRQAAMQQIQQSMATQASDLLASWTPPPTQSFVLVPDEKVTPTGDKKGAAGAEGGAGAGGFSGGGASKGKVIKAGTVLFGVLDTGINSDQDSPILATIIQGELKGARLVGNFTRRDEKVLVTFKTVSIPTVKNSIGVNAVAIDPEEARTALASRVDNHYFLRYGTLFASSFLSGLSSAITQSGSTVSTNANTGIVVQNTPKLNTGQKALVALGNVGQQYASVLGKNFTTPPTVTVDPGVGIGVLLMQDLTIPEDDQQLDVLLAKEAQKEKEQKQEERMEAMERAEMLRRGYREREQQPFE